MSGPLLARPSSADTARRQTLVDHLDLDLLRKDPVLADIVETAASICEAPVAHISLLGQDEQHTVAGVGITATTTPIERTFCRVAVESGRLLIIEDMTRDPRFADHPYVSGDPRYRFYAGLPALVGRRVAVGTLCVLDTTPRRLTVDQRADMFGLLRQVEVQIATHLEADVVDEIAVAEPADTPQGAQVQIRARKDILSDHLIAHALNQMTSLKSDAQYVRHNLRFGAQLRETHEAALSDISVGVDAATSSLRHARSLVQSPDGTLSGTPPISASETIDTVLELFAERIDRRAGAVKIDQNLDEDWVCADPVLFRDALLYLLHIALEATPSDDPIEIGIHPGNSEHLAVQITDTDDPLSQDEFERLSRRTSLGDDPTDIEDRKMARLAQTLTFCRLAVEAHNGRLVCEEAQGSQGRVFRLEFPV